MDKIQPQLHPPPTSSSVSTTKSSGDSEPFKRRRTRSGCVTCRDRHIKCDETQPVCNNCLRLKRVCYRGLRLNFTQYMLYDPRKDIPHCYGEVSSTTQPHRILDQSITIAALYNGLEKYRPYMHLHSQQDLRDSDLEYQDETYLPPNDSMLLGQSNTMVGRPVHHEKSGIISMNTQLERLAPISKYTRATPNPEPPLAYPNQIVMNSLQQSQSETVLPSLHFTNTQQQLHTLSYPTTIPPMQVTSPVQYTNFVVYNTNPLSYDPQHYINLLVKEQYFWLLDQFNDFNIWQTIIPVVCIKESDNFLFSCLI